MQCSKGNAPEPAGNRRHHQRTTTTEELPVMTEQSHASAQVPVAAYLLADHLDAALAAGEDLLATCTSATEEGALAFGHEIAGARARQRTLIETVRGLELALISRCIRARERAAELAADDARFTAVAGLFVGGTAALVDAIAECADSTTLDFDSGDGMLAYLRGRALVRDDLELLDEGEGISVGEGFLVAGRVALGPLLDLVAAFLDALELHFDLYEVAVDVAAGPSPAGQAEAA